MEGEGWISVVFVNARFLNGLPMPSKTYFAIYKSIYKICFESTLDTFGVDVSYDTPTSSIIDS